MYPVKSLHPIHRQTIQKPESVPQALFGIFEIQKLVADLTKLREEYSQKFFESHQKLQDAANEHSGELRELNKKFKSDGSLVLNEVLQKLIADQTKEFRKIFATLEKKIQDKVEEVNLLADKIQVTQKGEQGEKGDPGLTKDEVKKIIELIRASIKVPEIDHEKILGSVKQQIEDGKLKIKGDYIEGWQDPEVLLARFHARGGVRGGGDTVAAGSNITITSTNGVKTIAASGGFTALSSTETPNGTLTVFTFAAATAQPSYIVSDNVWLKATSKAGTINWTWNAGLKQATLTIPPTDDIFGIA